MHRDDTLRYKTSGMILKAHSDTSYYLNQNQGANQEDIFILEMQPTMPATLIV